MVSSAASWDRPQTCGPTGGLQTLGQRPWALLLGLPPTSGVTHLPASQVVLQDGGHLLGMRCCGGTHHAVPQTLIVGEKRLQPHESLFSRSCPFSSDWCLVAGHGTSGEGLSGSKSTAICCCEGHSRGPHFGTSPLPCSSLYLIARDVGRDQIVDC